MVDQIEDSEPCPVGIEDFVVFATEVGQDVRRIDCSVESLKQFKQETSVRLTSLENNVADPAVLDKIVAFGNLLAGVDVNENGTIYDEIEAISNAANAAKGAAEEALARSKNAEAKAEAAVSTANAAQTTANAAQETANSAVTKGNELEQRVKSLEDNPATGAVDAYTKQETRDLICAERRNNVAGLQAALAAYRAEMSKPCPVDPATAGGDASAPAQPSNVM